MKLLKKTLSILLMVGVLFLPVLGFAFDRHPSNFKEFGDVLGEDYYGRHRDKVYIDVSTSITKVTCLGTAEGFIPDWNKNNLRFIKATGVFGQEGSGWYMGNGYWVTNAHVVNPGSIRIQASKSLTFITSPIRILTKLITIGQNTGLGSVSAEVVYCDEEQDLALLKVVGNWLAFEDLGYRPAFTSDAWGDMLFPGMPVAVIVAIRQDPGIGNTDKTPWFEVRYGRIIAAKPICPGELHNDLLPWFQLGDVTTDLMIYPGDSGSPVFGFINGKPVFIGAARAVAGYQDWETGITYYYSYFARIDSLVRFTLEEIK